MIIVSACLSGVRCRFDGEHRENECIKKLVSERKAIPLCPEVAGGRPVPREPIEIEGGTGADVIAGRAKVKDEKGADVTEEVMEGVRQVLRTVKKLGIKTVILKTKSPTCGCGKIYDGSFKRKMIEGNGVLTDALRAEGIAVYTEENFKEILDTL